MAKSKVVKRRADGVTQRYTVGTDRPEAKAVKPSASAAAMHNPFSNPEASWENMQRMEAAWKEQGAPDDVDLALYAVAVTELVASVAPEHSPRDVATLAMHNRAFFAGAHAQGLHITEAADLILATPRERS